MTDPDRRTTALQRADQTRSRLAFGIFVICALFGLETAVAHHIHPNPASPVVWALLGGVGGAAAAASLWFRLRSRPPRD